jgi:hypothetical protein
MIRPTLHDGTEIVIQSLSINFFSLIVKYYNRHCSRLRLSQVHDIGSVFLKT